MSFAISFYRKPVEDWFYGWLEYVYKYVFDGVYPKQIYKLKATVLTGIYFDIFKTATFQNISRPSIAKNEYVVSLRKENLILELITFIKFI